MDTLWHCIAYSINCVDDTAFGHLEPQACEHGPKP